MSKTFCKSFKRDGSPCQGQGLEQFDGYCIAHAPADQTRQWRSRGGTNSSTAARADKRIPERLQSVIKDLAEGFTRCGKGLSAPPSTPPCAVAPERCANPTASPTRKWNRSAPKRPRPPPPKSPAHTATSTSSKPPTKSPPSRTSTGSTRMSNRVLQSPN